MPIDEFDDILFYSLAGSLPITGKGVEQEEIDESEALANRLLSSDEIEGYLNHLLSLGDDDGLLIKMKEAYAFDDILNLELSPGKHQLYASYVPMEGRIDSFSASEKITINVP